MLAIETKNVTKWFGKKKQIAIANLSLKIKSNQIFGLLGSNGAGKTTLLSIFATTLIPSKGSVRIYGKDVVKDKLAVRKMIGICSGYSGLFDDLTVRENMIYYSRMRKIRNKSKRINYLLKLVGLEKEKKTPARDLSTGMRQRLSLVISMLHKPKLLLMDEPTVGLDPKIAAKVRESIKKIQKRLNMTIILTTHNMYEAEQMCDNIALLKNGKLIEIETVEGLRKLLGGYQIIEVYTKKKIRKLASEGVKSISHEKEKTIIRIMDVARNLPKVLEELDEYGLKKLAVRELTLEELYLAHM